MSKFTVIETGGKQYRITSGQKIRIEKLPIPEGGVVVFDRVLLEADGEKVTIGTPYITGAQVKANLVRHARDKKKIVFRYHSKTRYRKKKGHRQHFSEVQF